jgi:hypothetical protein
MLPTLILRGLYIGKYLPPPPWGRESNRCPLSEKYEREKIKGGNVKEKRKMGKVKGRKGKCEVKE